MSDFQIRASKMARDTESRICEAYDCSATAKVFLFTGMPETTSRVYGLCDECFVRMHKV